MVQDNIRPEKKASCQGSAAKGGREMHKGSLAVKTGMGKPGET